MLNKAKEKKIEKILQAGFITNPAHKAALKERLMNHSIELSVEDLDLVAGGVMPEIPDFEELPDIDSLT